MRSNPCDLGRLRAIVQMLPGGGGAHGTVRMIDTPLVMYDEDLRKILAICQRLVRDANAKGIFLVDKNGQLVAEAGDRCLALPG